MKLSRWLLLVATLLVAGCTRSTLDAVTRPPGTGGSRSDSRADTAPDTTRADVAPDAGPDTGRDIALEPGPESGPEPGPEPAPEPAPDAGVDRGSDARAESDAATCPSTILGSGDTNQTVLVNGSPRTYLLHVPSSYKGNKPVPLVVDFHGLGVNGAMEKTLSPYPDLTDRDGAIIAFPDGAKGSITAWNAGPCCARDIDDVAFAKALVAQVRSMACIERQQVYAVGYSMGGGMAYYLACRAADVFAAFAPAGFDLMEEQLPDCVPARPITVISFRGTNDSIVPYGGGYSNLFSTMPVNFLGAKKTFQKWGELDQCGDETSEDSTTGCLSYTNCPLGAEVILCTKPGGGNEQGNAAIAWPVLKRHVLSY